MTGQRLSVRAGQPAELMSRTSWPDGKPIVLMSAISFSVIASFSPTFSAVRLACRRAAGVHGEGVSLYDGGRACERGT